MSVSRLVKAREGDLLFSVKKGTGHIKECANCFTSYMNLYIYIIIKRN